MSEQINPPLIELDVHTLDASAFHSALVLIHNTVVPDESVPDFDGNKNRMATGHGFPGPEDKVELLNYALEKAQLAKDPHDAALILAGSIPIIHPWGEGNGRTSRAIYRKLVKGDQIAPRELSREARILKVDEEARAEVDLGTVWGSGGILFPIRDRIVYERAGLPYKPYSQHRVRVMSFDSEGNKTPHESLSGKEAEGLTGEEIEDIQTAMGMGEKGIGATDAYALRFALAVTLTSEELQNVSVQKGDIEIADLRKFLEGGSQEQKAKFCAGLWTYRKMCAQVSIDILSDDFGAITTVIDGSREISLRDLFIEQSNNFKKTTAQLAGAAALQ